MEYTIAIVENGAVTNVIVADNPEWPNGIDITSADPRPGINWEYSNGEFTPPVSVPVDPLPTSRIITRRALRSRFTIAELVGIEIASLDDAAAPIETRQTAATLRVLLATLNAADFIDLDFAEARMGVQMIGQLGLLTAERVAEILDTPVDDSERP